MIDENIMYVLQCPACTKPKQPYLNLCPECQEKYGDRASDWPEWLRYLINDNKRLRSNAIKLMEREVSIGNTEVIDYLNYIYNTPAGISLRFEECYDEECEVDEYREDEYLDQAFDNINPDELDAEVIAVF